MSWLTPNTMRWIVGMSFVVTVMAWIVLDILAYNDLIEGNTITQVTRQAIRDYPILGFAMGGLFTGLAMHFFLD